MARDAHPVGVRSRGVALVAVLALVVSGCSATSGGASDEADVVASLSPAAAVEGNEGTPVAVTALPTPSAEPSATVQPSPIPRPTVAPSPLPTVTPAPTATSAPTPTPTVVDETPIVLQGDGWAITEAEIAKLASFVEDTHQLDFLAPVAVKVEDDIGAGFASTFEAFTEEGWILLTALGIVDPEIDRFEVNQGRRDRIRGVCCEFGDTTTVRVELQPTKLGTEVIIVHELTHALHTQYPSLYENHAEPSSEIPLPNAAALEGVPQYVAFAYLATAREPDQARVAPDLPIIRDDMVTAFGSGPARHLNFSYATGPSFVEAIVAERGLEVLVDLMTLPPSTSEQVIFPEKYLAGEEAVDVARPALPDGVIPLTSGRIGVANISFVIADVIGPQTARDLVSAWAGDSYVTYRVDGRTCLAAEIVMDSPEAAISLADPLDVGLSESVPDPDVAVSASSIAIRTC